MSEGHIFVCQWSEDSHGLHVSVRGRPRIRATYRTWDELHDQFWQVIMERCGDGEPVLTFDPPLPVPDEDRDLLEPGLALLSGAAYSGSKTSPGALFTHGLCPHCGRARGERNDLPAHFYSFDADVCCAPQEWWFAISGLYVSERFLSLLSDAERSCFEARLIERPPRSRRRYFEVIPRLFLPPVAHAHRAHSGGWRCPICDRQVIAQCVSDRLVYDFVAQVDLPDPLPPLFAIGDPVYFHLCTREARAVELLQKPESRGLLVRAVGALPDHLVDRRPPIRTCPSRSEVDQQRRDLLATWKKRLEQLQAERESGANRPGPRGDG